MPYGNPRDRITQALMSIQNPPPGGVGSGAPVGGMHSASTGIMPPAGPMGGMQQLSGLGPVQPQPQSMIPSLVPQPGGQQGMSQGVPQPPPMGPAGPQPPPMGPAGPQGAPPQAMMQSPPGLTGVGMDPRILPSY